MHHYLTRLGIRPEVQEFFRPYYFSDQPGNLLFSYGDGLEHFGFGFHHIPASAHFWMAGNLKFAQVRLVVLCASALDAVSWLNKKAASLSHTDGLLFLSSGAGVRQEHIGWIDQHLKHKTYCLIYGRDLLGRIADLKIAAGVRNLPVEIYAANEGISVHFRCCTFSFSQETFSLNAFEKAAGFRFGVRCDKPKNHLTFFDELKAEAFLQT